MGFALWVNHDASLAWAEGTHEYRPMGSAVIAASDQFRRRDFSPHRRRPKDLDPAFIGFFGSLEDLNASLHRRPAWKRRLTPGHLG
jgi:hypothetical protein